MRLIMLGAPGAGKGTQAVKLAERFGIPHISTGDIFRANIKNGTKLGKKAKEYIDKGMLVPDAVTTDIVKDRLRQDDCSKGFILDGFPRTIPQAEYLDNVLDEMGVILDAVLNLQVDDQDIIRRLSGRRVCPVCGMSFHMRYSPPAEDGKCTNCGADVIQREDDKEATVINRLRTYHEQTEPLIGYYAEKGKLLTAEGRKEVSQTTDEVLRVLGTLSK